MSPLCICPRSITNISTIPCTCRMLRTMTGERITFSWKVSARSKAKNSEHHIANDAGKEKGKLLTPCARRMPSRVSRSLTVAMDKWNGMHTPSAPCFETQTGNRDEKTGIRFPDERENTDTFFHEGDSDFDELALLVQLPEKLLFIKESDDDFVDYTIHARIDLKAGTILGSYRGGEVKGEEGSCVDEGKASLQLNRSDGPPLRVMLHDGGHWLKLMRAAATPADANICLQLSGSDVICIVTNDITRDVELKVTCRVANHSGDEEDNTSSSLKKCATHHRSQDSEVQEERDDNIRDVSSHDSCSAMLDLSETGKTHNDSAADIMPGQSLLIKKCKQEPVEDDSHRGRCIGEDYEAKGPEERSSSDSEACDRGRSPELDLSVSPSVENQDCEQKPSKTERMNQGESEEDKAGENTISSSGDGEESERSPELSNKHNKMGEKCYKCPFCPYFCYRRYVLAKHIKVHNSTPSVTSSTLPISGNGMTSQNSVTRVDRYCKECNIQFMSIKTYQVHKELYCSSRHDPSTMMTTTSESPLVTSGLCSEGPHVQNDSTMTSNEGAGCLPNNLKNSIANSPVIQPQAIFAAISTNPLILLPCSFINGQGLVPQNGIIPTGAGIVIPTGISAGVATGSVEGVVQSHLADDSNSTMEGSPGGGLTVDNLSSAFSSISAFTNSFSGGTLYNFKPNSLPSDHSNAKKAEIDIIASSFHSSRPSAYADAASASKRSNVDIPLENAIERSIPQEAPLDLSVRKRKSSIIVPQSSTVVKRRNSSTSSSSSSPATSSEASPSPTGERLSSRMISPTAFSNDASCSSACCASQSTVPIAGRRSPISGSGTHVITSVGEPLSPLPPVLAVENTVPSQRLVNHLSVPPPKLVKQGNNVCKECNIVFYKYDNYLAHKRHYCAYRRQHVSSTSTVNFVSLPDHHQQSVSESSSSGSISKEDAEREMTSKYVIRRTSEDKSRKTSHPRYCGRNEFSLEHVQNVASSSAASTSAVTSKCQSTAYCCDACGVKFSTPDNLEAHQTYYCSRQREILSPKCTMPVKRKRKSRDFSCSQCGGFLTQDSLESHCCTDEWKCNYCDVVCPSLKAARRHLLTHTEIRGFCCTICGYRGNTIRGMRSHIYEHLNGDNSQIEDMLATSVVVDNTKRIDGRRLDNSDEESNVTRDHKSFLIRDGGDTSSEPMDCRSSPPVLSEEASLSNGASYRSECFSDAGVSTLGSSENRFQCDACDFSSADRNCVLKHVHLKHGVKETSESQDGFTQKTTANNSNNESKNKTVSACDIIIKSEEDSNDEMMSEGGEQTSGDHSTRIKVEPAEDEEECPERYDDAKLMKDEEEISPGVASAKVTPTSVICKSRLHRQGAPEIKQETSVVMDEVTEPSPQQMPHLKQCLPKSSGAKYCKSCDISFNHLSNFIAHKKFYCVPRVIENFHQETPPVQ